MQDYKSAISYISNNSTNEQCAATACMNEPACCALLCKYTYMECDDGGQLQAK